MSTQEDKGDRPAVRQPIEKKQIREDVTSPKQVPGLKRPLVRTPAQRK